MDNRPAVAQVPHAMVETALVTRYAGVVREWRELADRCVSDLEVGMEGCVSADAPWNPVCLACSTTFSVTKLPFLGNGLQAGEARAI